MKSLNKTAGDQKTCEIGSGFRSIHANSGQVKMVESVESSRLQIVSD